MVFVRLAFFPEGTSDRHAAPGRELAEAPAPRGRLAFGAGPRDGGWQVVQVWDDESDPAAFSEQWLLPAR